jgi:hypothetical protein
MGVQVTQMTHMQMQGCLTTAAAVHGGQQQQQQEVRKGG